MTAEHWTAAEWREKLHFADAAAKVDWETSIWKVLDDFAAAEQRAEQAEAILESWKADNEGQIPPSLTQYREVSQALVEADAERDEARRRLAEVETENKILRGLQQRVTIDRGSFRQYMDNTSESKQARRYPEVKP